MTDGPFPDLEAAVCDLLETEIPGLTAGTVTPADFTAATPYARVLRHGGSDDFTTDTARITVDYFDVADRAATRAGAEQVRQVLTAPGPKTIGGVRLDLAATDSGPYEVPWNANNSPRRFVAAYSVSARR